MNTKLGFVSALSLALVGLMARPAAAGIDACGDIHVEASAMCAAEVEGGCEAHCTPLAMEAACRGKLEADCSGSRCTASAMASCTGTCEADCTGECEVNPPSFECSASCEAEAMADCSGHCETAENRAECEGACKATVQAECDASCEGQPASATCEAKCQASCEGQCEAEANVDCQIMCQGEAYAECQVEMQGECRVNCDPARGSMFCDGQYVDHGNNFQECVDALNAVVTATVDVSASGYSNAECSGNKCEAEAGGEASCSARMAPTVPRGGAAAILAGFGLALALGARRRRSA
jgi:hypothetical protein